MEKISNKPNQEVKTHARFAIEKIIRVSSDLGTDISYNLIYYNNSGSSDAFYEITSEQLDQLQSLIDEYKGITAVR